MITLKVLSVTVAVSCFLAVSAPQVRAAKLFLTSDVFKLVDRIGKCPIHFYLTSDNSASGETFFNRRRHALKDKFNELVQKGCVELHGKGRGFVEAGMPGWSPGAAIV